MSESNVIEASAGIARCKAELREQGWTILSRDLLRDGPRPALAHFGRIVPQFNGEETYEVTLKPGFEKLPFSQSKNAIGPHTEAPVYDPPPKYLALHCHRQAQCGGGQTLLADGFAFHASLSPELKAWADGNDVVFTASAMPGAERRLYRTRLVEEKDGARLFRFSYNQFRFGDVNPSEGDLAAGGGQAVQSPLGRIAECGEKFFYENMIQVLIPEGSMLIWDNQRLMHARSKYTDPVRHLTRYWLD
jgi:alpha-ketoglutarate-dependent taurine dioxygenase